MHYIRTLSTTHCQYVNDIEMPDNPKRYECSSIYTHTIISKVAMLHIINVHRCLFMYKNFVVVYKFCSYNIHHYKSCFCDYLEKRTMRS